MPTDLDQSGNYAQSTRTYLGPTVGWKDLPVAPERIVAGTSAVTIQPFESRILLQGAVTQVYLPDVVAWVKASFQRNQSPFDRSLWVKDLGGNATANNVQITPFAGQTIDTGTGWALVANGAIARFYPLFNLVGWYVG